MKEGWRICLDGYYSVSSVGRVRREIAASATRPGRLLKLKIGRGGYYTFAPSFAGVRKRSDVYVHSLVASTFIGARRRGMEVNHRDGDKLNNAVGNLEWVTHSENKRHAFRVGLQKPSAGETNGQAKLTASSVRAIRCARIAGRRPTDLARQYGVTDCTIIDVCARRSWRHIK